MLHRRMILPALAVCAIVGSASAAHAKCEFTNTGRTICLGSPLPPAQRSSHRTGRQHERRVASVRHLRHPGGGADPCPYERVGTAAGVICISGRVADKMKGFIADVVARGFKGQVHCYSTSSSHVSHSLHFVGEACDFAQRGWGKTVRPMYSVSDLTSKWGLRNGCTFRDCGHVDSGRLRTARHGHRRVHVAKS